MNPMIRAVAATPQTSIGQQPDDAAAERQAGRFITAGSSGRPQAVADGAHVPK